ncbi:hypothetical protein D4R78_03110 [bacterium]|nr:MAG: hypothetical protein D4R78_03110 [bacterium]
MIKNRDETQSRKPRKMFLPNFRKQKLLVIFLCVIFSLNIVSPAYARPGNYGNKEAWELWGLGLISGAITAIGVGLTGPIGAISSIASDLTGLIWYQTSYSTYGKEMFEVFGVEITQGQFYSMVVGVGVSFIAGSISGLLKGGVTAVADMGTSVAASVATAAATSTVQSIIATIINVIVKIAKAIAKFIVALAKAIVKYIVDLIKGIVKSIVNFVKSIVRFFKSLIKSIIYFFKHPIKAIVKLIQKIVSAIKKFIHNIKELRTANKLQLQMLKEGKTTWGKMFQDLIKDVPNNYYKYTVTGQYYMLPVQLTMDLAGGTVRLVTAKVIQEKLEEEGWDETVASIAGDVVGMYVGGFVAGMLLDLTCGVINLIKPLAMARPTNTGGIVFAKEAAILLDGQNNLNMKVEDVEGLEGFTYGEIARAKVDYVPDGNGGHKEVITIGSKILPLTAELRNSINFVNNKFMADNPGFQRLLTMTGGVMTGINGTPITNGNKLGYEEVGFNPLRTGFKVVQSMGISPLLSAGVQVAMLKALGYETYYGSTDNDRIYENAWKMAAATALGNFTADLVNVSGVNMLLGSGFSSNPDLQSAQGMAQKQAILQKMNPWDTTGGLDVGLYLTKQATNELANFAIQLAWLKYCRNNDIMPGDPIRQMGFLGASVLSAGLTDALFRQDKGLAFNLNSAGTSTGSTIKTDEVSDPYRNSTVGLSAEGIQRFTASVIEDYNNYFTQAAIDTFPLAYDYRRHGTGLAAEALQAQWRVQDRLGNYGSLMARGMMPVEILANNFAYNVNYWATQNLANSITYSALNRILPLDFRSYAAFIPSYYKAKLKEVELAKEQEMTQEERNKVSRLNEIEEKLAQAQEELNQAKENFNQAKENFVKNAVDYQGEAGIELKNKLDRLDEQINGYPQQINGYQQQIDEAKKIILKTAIRLNVENSPELADSEQRYAAGLPNNDLYKPPSIVSADNNADNNTVSVDLGTLWKYAPSIYLASEAVQNEYLRAVQPAVENYLQRRIAELEIMKRKAAIAADPATSLALSMLPFGQAAINSYWSNPLSEGGTLGDLNQVITGGIVDYNLRRFASAIKDSPELKAVWRNKIIKSSMSEKDKEDNLRAIDQGLFSFITSTYYPSIAGVPQAHKTYGNALVARAFFEGEVNYQLAKAGYDYEQIFNYIKDDIPDEYKVKKEDGEIDLEATKNKFIKLINEYKNLSGLYSRDAYLLDRTMVDRFGRLKHTDYFTLEDDAQGNFISVPQDKFTDYYYNQFGLASSVTKDFSYIELPQWEKIQGAQELVKIPDTTVQPADNKATEARAPVNIGGTVGTETVGIDLWYINQFLNYKLDKDLKITPEAQVKLDELSGKILDGEAGLPVLKTGLLAKWDGYSTEEKNKFLEDYSKVATRAWKSETPVMISEGYLTGTLSGLTYFGTVTRGKTADGRTWKDMSIDEKAAILIGLNTGWRLSAAAAYDRDKVPQDFVNSLMVTPGAIAPRTTSYLEPGSKADPVDIKNVNTIYLPGRITRIPSSPGQSDIPEPIIPPQETLVPLVAKTLEKISPAMVGPNITRDSNLYSTGRGASPYTGPTHRILSYEINSGPYLEARRGQGADMIKVWLGYLGQSKFFGADGSNDSLELSKELGLEENYKQAKEAFDKFKNNEVKYKELNEDLEDLDIFYTNKTERPIYNILKSDTDKAIAKTSKQLFEKWLGSDAGNGKTVYSKFFADKLNAKQEEVNRYFDQDDSRIQNTVFYKFDVLPGSRTSYVTFAKPNWELNANYVLSGQGLDANLVTRDRYSAQYRYDGIPSRINNFLGKVTDPDSQVSRLNEIEQKLAQAQQELKQVKEDFRQAKEDFVKNAVYRQGKVGMIKLKNKLGSLDEQISGYQQQISGYQQQISEAHQEDLRADLNDMSITTFGNTGFVRKGESDVYYNAFYEKYAQTLLPQNVSGFRESELLIGDQIVIPVIDLKTKNAYVIFPFKENPVKENKTVPNQQENPNIDNNIYSPLNNDYTNPYQWNSLYNNRFNNIK